MTMGWPLSQDYNEAVQNLRTSVADPDLKAGTAVPGPLGLPLPRSGNFADVYEIRGADGRAWALKCFTRPANQLGNRYRAIDERLRGAALPFTVGFEFLPGGIRVREHWYPALKMEWVEGLQLNEFVRRNAGRPEHLKAILGLWVRLCRRLRDARIAHADLQHGNVLLVPGKTANTLKMRLIDYDGMWVPALAGQPSGEAGHPNYQHPGRLREQAYSADADRFPHLVIGCALRALAVAGKSLWERFDNGDNLLFREADFADPANSRVFRALWELDDPTVTNLVALLVLSARRPLGDTPWLDDVLSGEETVPVSDAVLARAADAIGVPRRAARQAVPVAQLYVVPEEGGDFSELGGGARSQARRRSKLPALLAGGTAAVVAGVVTAVLLFGGGPRDETNVTLPAGGDGTTALPGTGMGTIETRWVDFPSAPQAQGAPALMSGIDVVPPGSKLVRSYPVSGVAALGAWLLPDGKHALLANRIQVAVLDLDTGELRPTVKFVEKPTTVAHTPDGRFVVTASLVGAESVVRCLDPTTGAEQWTKTFPGTVTVLAVSPDGERVAASGLRVGYVEWAMADGTEVRRHGRLQASLLAFSPDGAAAVAATENGVELWSLRTGSASVIGPGVTPTAICVTADGEQALAASGGAEVKVWALSDGRPLPDRPALIRPLVTTLAATGDGTLLFGGPAGEYGYLGADGTHVSQSLGPMAGAIVSFSTTEDGRYVLVASEKGNVALTRLADLVRPDGPSPTGPMAGCLEFVRSVPLPAGTHYFAADARGDRFLTATSTHIRVYSADGFTAGRPLQVPGGGIVATGFGPDDTIVVCQAEGEGFVTRAYDPDGGDSGPVFALGAGVDGRPGRITRIVPVPEHPWVLTTTEAAGDVLFDPATGRHVADWPTPRVGDRTVAAASPDGKLIAFATPSEPVKLWNANTTTVGRTLEASVGVIVLAFTPDGKRLVGLWPHGRVRVWDPLPGRLLGEVGHDHPGPFGEMASVGNNLVALGPAPNQVLLNLDSGTALNTGNGPDPSVGRGFVIPPRGWVLAVDRDDRLTAWRVNAESAARLPAQRPKAGRWPDVRVLRDAPASPPVGLVFAANGKSLISATEDGRLTRYSADRLLYLGEVQAEEAPLYGLAQAGDRLITLGRGSRVTVRDAGTFEKLFEISSKAPGNVLPTLLAVNDDATALLVMADKPRLIDIGLKREIDVAAMPTAAVGKPLTQFAFSADGRIAVGRWGDSVLAVWHPKTGESRMLDELRTPIVATAHALALTTDGMIALLGTGDGKLSTWDTATGTVLHTKDAYPDAGRGEAITAVAVLPGGKRCVTAGLDGRIILWQLDGLKVIKEYRGPVGAWHLTVAPDGRSAVLQQSGSIERIELPGSL
jgi:WD40 repeat protein